MGTKTSRGKSTRKVIFRSFPVSLPAKVLEKVGWIADEEGVTKAEWVRSIIRDATKHAKRPISLTPTPIQATPDEWASWTELASRAGVSVEELVRATLNRLASRQSP